jgi:hypothetical protein
MHTRKYSAEQRNRGRVSTRQDITGYDMTEQDIIGETKMEDNKK